jgi:hypothetical protein
LLPHIALTKQTPYVRSSNTINFEVMPGLKVFQRNQRLIAKYAIHSQNAILWTSEALLVQSILKFLHSVASVVQPDCCWADQFLSRRALLLGGRLLGRRSARNGTLCCQSGRRRKRKDRESAEQRDTDHANDTVFMEHIELSTFFLHQENVKNILSCSDRGVNIFLNMFS